MCIVFQRCCELQRSVPPVFHSETQQEVFGMRRSGCTCANPFEGGCPSHSCNSLTLPSHPFHLFIFFPLSFWFLTFFFFFFYHLGVALCGSHLFFGTSYFHNVGEMRKRLEGSQQTPGPDPGDKGPTCGLREEWKGGRWAI